jgi:hypothetical protein
MLARNKILIVYLFFIMPFTLITHPDSASDLNKLLELSLEHLNARRKAFLLFSLSLINKYEKDFGA